MTIPALDADRSRFLAAVTLAAAEKFGADGELRKWRIARVGVGCTRASHLTWVWLWRPRSSARQRCGSPT